MIAICTYLICFLQWSVSALSELNQVIINSYSILYIDTWVYTKHTHINMYVKFSSITNIRVFIYLLCIASRCFYNSRLTDILRTLCNFLLLHHCIICPNYMLLWLFRVYYICRVNGVTYFYCYISYV